MSSRGGDMALSSVAAGLIDAERGSHRLKGDRAIRGLIGALRPRNRAHPVTPMREAG